MNSFDFKYQVIMNTVTIAQPHIEHLYNKLSSLSTMVSTYYIFYIYYAGCGDYVSCRRKKTCRRKKSLKYAHKMNIEHRNTLAAAARRVRSANGFVSTWGLKVHLRGTTSLIFLSVCCFLKPLDQISESC